MIGNAEKHFLRMVIPWPVDGHGFINLHHKRLIPAINDYKVTGKFFQALEKFTSYSDWALVAPGITDQWFCTSLQSETKTNTRGNAVAHRLSANARALKAIWADIDIKDDPLHYHSFDEAWAAVKALCKKNSLPRPSAIVKTGGGLHVYWISDKVLTPNEWFSYAEGLRKLLQADGVKCDLGLTTDNVRLLRVPGTLNHKYDPPRPVELLSLPLIPYDFTKRFSHLQALGAATATVNSPAKTEYFDAAAFAGATPDPAFASLSPSAERLGDGLTTKIDLVDPRPIFKKCAFYKDALKTGGEHHDNPLWNLAVLGTAFMERGELFAHEISKGYAKYDHGETQKLYERKVADRHEKGLGWPSCRTIQANGCTLCAACPHFAAGKSPITLALAPKLPQLTASVQQAQNALCLPDGYALNTAGYICKIHTVTKANGEKITTLLQLFLCKLDQPWAESGNPDALNFRTTTDFNNFNDARVTHPEMSSFQFKFVLATQKVKIVADNARWLEGFFLSWLAKLHSLKAAAQSQPYGWYRENGARRGFVYDSKLLMDTGEVLSATAGDATLKGWYTPVGQLQPWFDAVKLITDQKRPGLEVMVAQAFAGPIFAMTGQTGAMLSIFGESGSHKSHAIACGVAVWGDPKKAKETPASTVKQVEHRMGLLRQIPTYWDEIWEEKDMARVLTVVGQIAYGSEGGRLTSDIKMRDKGTWDTVISIASNRSFKEYAIKMRPSDAAALNRVLEIEVNRPDPSAQGLISTTDAARTLQLLETNYGAMGSRYAAHLARHHAAIDARVAACCKEIEQRHNATNDERLWVAQVGATIVGAELANQLGASFNLELLRDFLHETFDANRHGKIEANVEANSEASSDEILGEYLKARTQNMLWTEGFFAGMGKPTGINVLNSPEQRGFAGKWAVQVHWDVERKELLISRPDLRKWISEQPNMSILATVRGIIKTYGGRETALVLGRGTKYALKQEKVIVIPVSKHNAPDLWDTLMAYSRPQDTGAATGLADAS